MQEKVYVVIGTYYHDYDAGQAVSVSAVFRDKDRADYYVEQRKDTGTYYEVEEVDLY